MVTEKVKVLFLAANPRTTVPLQGDEEFRDITAKIAASRYRDRFELVSRWAVRSDDLIQTLNEHKPDIVHFSGHGDPSGQLVVVDAAGSEQYLSTRAICKLFETLAKQVRVVVLNACHSKELAQVLVEVIDCAIGMEAPAQVNDLRFSRDGLLLAAGAGGPHLGSGYGSVRLWRLGSRPEGLTGAPAPAPAHGPQSTSDESYPGGQP